jgi:F-type H+-transporting ATPase subunit delta
MPAFSDKQAAIAGVYARAMLELAEGSDQGDALGEELAGLAAALGRDPALGDFFANPRLDAERRAGSLERMLRGRASDLLVDSLQVLNRKGRAALVPAIAVAYAAALDKRRGRVEAKVASAQPLSDEQRRRLRQAIANATGREPVLRERVDPELIGGLVVQIGDRKVDGSVVHKIKTLSAALLARASREIQSGVHVAD